MCIKGGKTNKKKVRSINPYNLSYHLKKKSKFWNGE